MTKIRISSFPEEVQIELEIQAESAGMTPEEYAAELLHEALESLRSGAMSIDDFIDTSDVRNPIVH
ncbi:hypothetical protein KXR63_00650 [Stutzerimonas chloritidismutans]|uniref:hypothetical protein n=1 Tax=Stutzerimonas chloritidismutans TaxID=203192 RepID=UPI003F179EA3